MSLNNLPAGDKFRREVRTEWGGINLNENAGDGELIEALNMSSRAFPLLANARMSRTGIPADIVVPYTYDGKLGYIHKVDNSYFLYDPTRPTAASKLLRQGDILSLQTATLGTRMVMTQIKQMYDFADGTLTDMDAAQTVSGAFFTDGYYAGVAAENNTLYKPGAAWGTKFSVGDAVTISGCDEAANNKTAIIREIDGDSLRFYENTFADGWRWYGTSGSLPAGVYRFQQDGVWKSFTAPDIPSNTIIRSHGNEIDWKAGDLITTLMLDNPTKDTGTELGFTDGMYSYGDITVTRTVPDMDFVCANENRVWGCKGDTIYASKLGDPLNFNVFDGLSTDSWSVDTGTPGDFTGCCSFQGYPTFFKENAVFRIMGDEPRSFTLRKLNIQGVKAGSAYSIVEIRSSLYYLSRVGILQWNGGDYPTVISGALGGEPGMLRHANAGTDSLRYYAWLYMYQYDESFNAYVSVYKLCVFDTRYGTWHEIAVDEPYVTNIRFTGDGANGWMITRDITPQGLGYVYALHEFNSGSDTDTEWRVTFADSTRAYKTALTGSESKKGVLRLLIRCRLAGTMKVWLAYDGGDFEEAAAFGGEDGMEKGSRVVPLVLRRCDFWQLRLTGTGDAVIYSIAVERYAGEWQQA